MDTVNSLGTDPNPEIKDHSLLGGKVRITEFSSSNKVVFMVYVFDLDGNALATFASEVDEANNQNTLNEIVEYINTELYGLDSDKDYTILVNYLRKLNIYELDPVSLIELNTPLVERKLLDIDLKKANSNNFFYSNIPGELKTEIKTILMHSLYDPELLGELIDAFTSAQKTDLYLLEKGDRGSKEDIYNLDGTLSYEKLKKAGLVKHTALSMLPIVLSEEQEKNLREMVNLITLAKLSILQQSSEDTDLQSLLTDGLSEICQEITIANFRRINDKFRLRYDTFSSISPGFISTFELNGNEPQGDVANSKNYMILQEHLTRFLRKLGASDTDIQYCFAPMTIPVNAVGESILEIYNFHSPLFSELPYRPTVGFMAFKNAKTGAPFSPISNIEAQQSRSMFRRIPGLEDSVAFDPFDIADFRSLTGSGNFIIPIIRTLNEEGEETFKEVHFIRRLSGSLLSSGKETWSVLKTTRPEIYYKFIGLKHENHNPLGQSIPDWMWMNPLVPSLTDKRLDAILTDPRLLHRFNVREKIKEYLVKSQTDLGNKNLEEMADYILKSCLEYIPKTRILSRADYTGLFKQDKDFSTSLSEREIEDIKRDRTKYVIKFNALTGSSGNGVFIGASFSFEEVPKSIYKKITSDELKEIRSLLGSSKHEFKEKIDKLSDEKLINILRKNKKLSSLIEFKLRNLLWSHIVDHAIEEGQAIVQTLARTVTHTVIPITLDVRSDEFNISVTKAIVDINPQTIGTRMTGTHSRYVICPEKGNGVEKGNITGDSLGVGRNVVLPNEVASRIVALYKVLTECHEIHHH